MSTPNLSLMLDHHVVDEIHAAQQEADDALERYVDAKRKISELESLRDLRKAMGATVDGTASLVPTLLREAVSR